MYDTRLNIGDETFSWEYDTIGNVACTTDDNYGIASAFDQDAYGNVKTGSQDGYHLTTKKYDDPEYSCKSKNR